MLFKLWWVFSFLFYLFIFLTLSCYFIKLHRYLNNTLYEFKVLKKVIKTEMFNVDIHDNFNKCGLFCFFSFLHIYIIYIYIYIYIYSASFCSLSLSIYIYIERERERNREKEKYCSLFDHWTEENNPYKYITKLKLCFIATASGGEVPLLEI